jgi:photosystem II stability/assembly factor-like uncharacterized protein
MAVDPEDPGRIWAAYANAVYRTANGGGRWVRVPGPSGLLLTGPLAIGAGSQVYAEGRDNNGKGIWTADRDGASWRQLLGSPEITRIDTFRLASDLSTLYAAGSDLFNQEVVYRSTDGGATWQPRSSGASLPAPGPGCRIEDLSVAPSDAGVLYIAGSTYDPAIPGCRSTVIRSDDGGATWTSLGGGPPVGVVSHLAVDPRDPDIVYAGTGDGLTPGDGLWKSTDGGGTWSKIDNFRVQSITALLASAVPGRVYAATLGQIFRSDDGGATWRTRNRALRTEGVFELVADPVDPHRIYAATLNGVWTLREAD